MEFTKAFNEKTKDLMGFKVPTVITVYTDRSFTFETKQPTASALLMKAANIKKGTDNPLKNKVAKLTKAQLMEVVERKIVDLNTDDKEMAVNTIAGTARSMGIDIVD
jgi:large subunit ribosomal protein L11